ncbi:MAG TPA: hypothetical protein VFW07_04030 [Parafilimonas sp.]|nr:hypothetical protein [Parafilimonas sp.]
MIDKNKALEIAGENAGKFYRDLSVYDVLIKLEDDNWHVDYILKDKHLDGGGPHYIISAATGEIVDMRFEQ